MLFVAVVVALVVAIYCGLRIERWRHTPRELRGDWWTGFDSEFRAYVNRLEQTRGPRQRRNEHGSIGQ